MASPGLFPLLQERDHWVTSHRIGKMEKGEVLFNSMIHVEERQRKVKWRIPDVSYYKKQPQRWKEEFWILNTDAHAYWCLTSNQSHHPGSQNALVHGLPQHLQWPPPHTKQGFLLPTASSFIQTWLLWHWPILTQHPSGRETHHQTGQPMELKHCGNFYGTEVLTRSTQYQCWLSWLWKGAGKGSPKDTSFPLAFHFSSIRRLPFFIILFPCSVLRVIWMDSKTQCLLSTVISSDKCIM